MLTITRTHSIAHYGLWIHLGGARRTAMQNRQNAFDVLNALEKHVYDDPQVYWVMCEALNQKIMDHILELGAIGDAPEEIKKWLRERIRVLDHRRYVALDYANRRLNKAGGGSLA